MNLVVADAVNLGEEEMETFLQRLDPTIFGGERPMRKAVQAIWDSLEHVAELGSLIQPGAEVERALSQPLDETAVQLSFAGSDHSEILEITERLHGDSVENARDYLLVTLQEFAVQNGDGDVSQRLFAKETVKGLKLLGMLNNQFDSLVMNPPYGSPERSVEKRVRERYEASSGSMYAAFAERAYSVARSGYIGALTSNSFLKIKDFTDLRRDMIDIRTLCTAIDCWAALSLRLRLGCSTLFVCVAANAFSSTVEISSQAASSKRFTTISSIEKPLLKLSMSSFHSTPFHAFA
jgi:hypothetical protein